MVESVFGGERRAGLFAPSPFHSLALKLWKERDGDCLLAAVCCYQESVERRLVLLLGAVSFGKSVVCYILYSLIVAARVLVAYDVAEVICCA